MTTKSYCSIAILIKLSRHTTSRCLLSLSPASNIVPGSKWQWSPNCFAKYLANDINACGLPCDHSDDLSAEFCMNSLHDRNTDSPIKITSKHHHRQHEGIAFGIPFQTLWDVTWHVFWGGMKCSMLCHNRDVGICIAGRKIRLTLVFLHDPPKKTASTMVPLLCSSCVSFRGFLTLVF